MRLFLGLFLVFSLAQSQNDEIEEPDLESAVEDAGRIFEAPGVKPALPPTIPPSVPAGRWGTRPESETPAPEASETLIRGAAPEGPVVDLTPQPPLPRKPDPAFERYRKAQFKIIGRSRYDRQVKKWLRMIVESAPRPDSEVVMEVLRRKSPKIVVDKSRRMEDFVEVSGGRIRLRPGDPGGAPYSDEAMSALAEHGLFNVHSRSLLGLSLDPVLDEMRAYDAEFRLAHRYHFAGGSLDFMPPGRRRLYASWLRHRDGYRSNLARILSVSPGVLDPAAATLFQLEKKCRRQISLSSGELRRERELEFVRRTEQSNEALILANQRLFDLGKISKSEWGNFQARITKETGKVRKNPTPHFEAWIDEAGRIYSDDEERKILRSMLKGIAKERRLSEEVEEADREWRIEHGL